MNEIGRQLAAVRHDGGGFPLTHIAGSGDAVQRRKIARPFGQRVLDDVQKFVEQGCGFRRRRWPNPIFFSEFVFDP
ncbi:MAG: hypothetical protein RMN24_08505, partial [Anaerolineae bacterium]|nr:hypothetical protein [Anaerolineae bacterium]